MNQKEKDRQTRKDARPDRRTRQSAYGTKWYADHPEVNRQRVAGYRAEKGNNCSGFYAEMLTKSYNPLLFESDNVAVTGDYHIPFLNEPLLNKLLQVPETHGTEDLIIAGDFFDCDDFSRFTHLSAPACFEEECENVQFVLKRILQAFKNVYICRGNHERRWLDLNAGKMNINQLFALVRPSNMSEDEWDQRVHITMDDRINFVQKGQLWMSCHPRNFRQINLSVARDLAAKHHCNVIVAHGHQFCQGYDRSGTFRILDGGGLFDQDALAYLRVTSCYPQTKSGFYVIKDGAVISYEGK